MKNIFISKTDLAQAYFPYIEARCARKKLMQLIKDDAPLLSDLIASGYTTTCKLLSPLQVNLIIKRLGNPFN